MSAKPPPDERLALRCYAVLLRLYPERRRRAFGAQMLQTFRDEYRDRIAQDGKAGPAPRNERRNAARVAGLDSPASTVMNAGTGAQQTAP
ncbi:MAG: hypothetical protein ACTHMP_08035 [Thermomicrobiales bacterium]